ncbi:hypothetical protein SETIT_1G316600v2 [Setaria italica]|uniref:Uncharacterized protein n=1 Tax=Setaria italica TaxID=4555 RepID=A0A368PS47_SETIT|nr:hypothetical protein SETIT_1G316600v2 [Setaria italica]
MQIEYYEQCRCQEARICPKVRFAFLVQWPESGGSHKSIKCMPCCKRYIGNAFSSFHTLTGQIAQRHDLLKCLVLVNCAKDLLILSKCLHSQNSTGNWFVKLLQC